MGGSAPHVSSHFERVDGVADDALPELELLLREYSSDLICSDAGLEPWR